MQLPHSSRTVENTIHPRCAWVISLKLGFEISPVEPTGISLGVVSILDRWTLNSVGCPVFLCPGYSSHAEWVLCTILSHNVRINFSALPITLSWADFNQVVRWNQSTGTRVPCLLHIAALMWDVNHRHDNKHVPASFFPSHYSVFNLLVFIFDSQIPKHALRNWDCQKPSRSLRLRHMNSGTSQCPQLRIH